MREYVVGNLMNQAAAEKAVNLLAEKGIKASFVQVSRRYEVVIVGFENFHMALAIVDAMDAE